MKIKQLLLAAAIALTGIVATAGNKPAKEVKAAEVRQVLNANDLTIPSSTKIATDYEFATGFTAYNPGVYTLKIEGNKNETAPATTYPISITTPYNFTKRLNDQTKLSNAGGIKFSTEAPSSVYIYASNGANIGVYNFTGFTKNSSPVVPVQQAAGAWMKFDLATAGDYILSVSGTTYYRYIEVVEQDTGVTPAQRVINKINEIGVVSYTKTSLDTIEEIEELYAALSETEKAEVTNHAVLTDARASFETLKDAAVAAFVAAVDAIGVVDGSSLDKLVAAYDAYDVLLAAEKADATVVANYEILNAKQSEYDADYVSYVLDNDSIGAYRVVKNEVVPVRGTIFEISHCVYDTTNQVLPNGVVASHRIKTDGSSSASNTRGIKFTAPSKGSIVAYFMSGSSKNELRSIQLFNESFAVVDPGVATENASSATYAELAVPSAGTYYIGGDANISIMYVQFLALNVAAQADVAGPNVRFLGITNSYENIDSMHIEITATDSTGAAIGTRDYAVASVYKNISASENGVNRVVSASELGGRYIFSIVLTNVPAGTDFSVKMYAQIGENKVYSGEKVFHFEMVGEVPTVTIV